MDHLNLLNSKCGGSKSDYYLAKSLGAPFDVYLANGVEQKINPVTGKKSVEIKDPPGLVASVARARVLHARKMSGDDMKFLRTAVCLKSKVLAEAIDLSPEHYSRCEAGQKTMSPTAEKLYRGYIFLATYLKDKALMTKCTAKKDEISPEDAKKAFSTFQKLFFEIKINPVFDSNERLEFVFCRRSEPHGAPCGGDDAEWKNDLDINLEAA
jgi:DNA-binding transcriptional regulator YiaG